MKIEINDEVIKEAQKRLREDGYAVIETETEIKNYVESAILDSLSFIRLLAKNSKL